MSESLFTDQTPVVVNASDGTPGITCGVTVEFALGGTVTAVRFYATADRSGVYSVRFDEVTASDDAPAFTPLSSAVLGAPPTAGWNTVALPAPVPVETGKLYRPSYFSGDGRYVATLGVFTGADIVNGNITAFRDGADPVGLGSIKQGVFRVNATAGYPSTAGNGTNYFADVVFEEASVAVNARIVPSATGVGAIVNPGAAGTPAVTAVVLVDGAGNILKAADNGDGTATLASTTTVTVEPAAVTDSTNFSATGAISATPKDYRGFTIRETSGTAGAVVRIWDDDNGTTGDVLEEIALAPGESAREFYGDGGIRTTVGVYLQVVSGAVVGSVRTAV